MSCIELAGFLQSDRGGLLREAKLRLGFLPAHSLRQCSCGDVGTSQEPLIEPSADCHLTSTERCCYYVSMEGLEASWNTSSKAIVPRSFYKSVPFHPGYFPIRLLTILPGLEHERLECRLRTSKLSAKTSFEALSYTWGSRRCDREIIVNKHPFAVTENLEDALRALRRSDKKRKIWVDAVCINQNDLAEKGICVQEMSYIYKMADQVLIWLGKAGQHTDLAISHIHGTLDRSPPIQDLRPSDRYQDLALRAQWRRYWDLDKSIAAGLADIAGRQWWRRVWVVQELCMAVGDPLLVCGHSRVPWTCFIQQLRTSYVASGEHVLDMDNLRYRAQKHPRVRNFFAPFDPETSLLEDDLHWLRHTAAFEASDARDKIFGLLSLMRGPLRKQIRVDYTIRLEELARRLTMDQIAMHHSLDLLVLCRYTEPNTRPTWLLDLSTPGLPALPSSLPAVELPRDPYFQFCSSRREHVREVMAGATTCRELAILENSVVAQGYLLGIVKPALESTDRLKQGLRRSMNGQMDIHSRVVDRRQPGRIMYTREENRMTAEALKKCDRHLESAKVFALPSRPWDLSPATIGGQLKAVDDYRRELELRASDGIEHNPNDRLKLAEQYAQLLHDAIDGARLHCHWQPVFSKLLSNESTGESEHLKIDNLLCWDVDNETVQPGRRTEASVLHAMGPRPPFVTDTGLIGVGPIELQHEDRIVLFDASSFAFALRESGAGYKLIGQVLVCPPMLPAEYPVQEWLDGRPTDYPCSWREPTRHEFVLE